MSAAPTTKSREPQRIRVLVSGSSGLIGSALLPRLAGMDWSVTRLIRSKPGRGDTAVAWDPAGGTIDAGALDGFDAVVHLAAENLGGERWNHGKKARIRDSRVGGARLLVAALAARARRPRTLITASATSYYGDRGARWADEMTPAGSGFLAEVCRDAEAAAEGAAWRGLRVVHLRFGAVLSAQGGALAALLQPFRRGLGGPIGSGDQYVSWVAIDDAVAAILHAVRTRSVHGPVNVVAPDPVTNREFAETLGRVIGRAAGTGMPAFAARLLLGEMVDEVILPSIRVRPTRLLETRFTFRHPRLEDALRALLGDAAGAG